MESIQIPATSINLIWHGAEQKSYKVGIYLELLPDVPAEWVAKIDRVHVEVQIAGRLWRKVFDAKENLFWIVYWDRTDLYDKVIVGLAIARGIFIFY